MKAKDSIWVLWIGIIISIISFTLAFLKINFWYLPATIGVWFIFDYISSIKNKNTAIQIFLKNKNKFFDLFLIMFFLGASIELGGRFLLNLWNYPPINSFYMEMIMLLVYPFILFSFREMYESINIFIKKNYVSFIFSMILGIIIWEIPNLFSVDWIYTIPYTNFSIFKINIIIILGWSILIGFPIYIYKKLRIKN